jgi:hypothetical protein
LQGTWVETVARYFAHRLWCEIVKDATFSESVNVVQDVTVGSILHIDPSETIYRIMHDSEDAVDAIRSNRSIRIDPTNDGEASGVVEIPAVVEFTNGVAQKIRFYGNEYSVFVDTNQLRFISDGNFAFKSDDAAQSALIINGDERDITVGDDIYAGGDIEASGRVTTLSYFANKAETGDKWYLYGPENQLYRIGISPITIEVYTDKWVHWSSDTHSDTIRFDVDEGRIYANFLNGDGSSVTNVNAAYLDSATKGEFILKAGDSFHGNIHSEDNEIQLQPDTGRVKNKFNQLKKISGTREEIINQTEEGDLIYAEVEEGISMGFRSADYLHLQPLLTYTGTSGKAVLVRSATDLLEVRTWTN